MERYDDKNADEVPILLKKLCNKLCPKKGVNELAYRVAVSTMATMQDNHPRILDDVLNHQIKQYLLKTKTTRDVEKFSEFYQKIKTSVVLNNHAAILEFLYTLGVASTKDAETQRSDTYAELNHARQMVSSLSVPSFGSNTTDDSHIKQAFVSSHLTNHGGSSDYLIDKNYKGFKKENHVKNEPPVMKSKYNKTNETIELSEKEMIREVIYLAQGVGKRENLLNNKHYIRRSGLVSRLAELGFLHDKICFYMDPLSGCMPIGLVGEGLVSAFRNELTEYYRSLAILQSQLSSTTIGQSADITLRRLLVWGLEPLHRLKWLATIGYASQNKKGGELATCVYRFLFHGDPRLTTLVHQLLATVCYPLYVMLCRWLLDGEIDDPHHEFFIEGRSSVPTERLWHDKYRVREAMLPAFISRQQAQHILATGKSVTFLREVCGDRGQLGERESLKKVLDSSNVELLFSGGTNTKLHGIMSSAYLGVSRRLLDTLVGPHKLLEHLKALRAYLLLEQGDFIHQLMVLLEPELNKSASQLYVHNLTCILESAIRATNAQYDDGEILNRLYVNLYPPSPEDSGWDVFSLFYRVEGPLGTVLEPEAAASYRTLFTHLWRAKRMEHILAQMWKHHTIEYKKFSKMTEVMPLLRRLHALRSEMVHLVKELQYALFVVVECASRTLVTEARKAHALDELLAAHRHFLSTVTSGALLDDNTKSLQSYLGNVYAEILSLRDFEKMLYNKISQEYERRKNIDQLIEDRCKKGQYGIDKAEEKKNAEDLNIFKQYLTERKADLNVLSRTYRGHVKTFILKLALQTDIGHQFLLFRLDYNDFYKRGDSKLHEPLTYQHKRLSEVGIKSLRHNGVPKTNKDTYKREKLKIPK